MKRIKLGINARTLATSNIRGWSRYTINLLQALCELDIDLVLFSDREIHPIFLNRLPVDRYRVVIEKAPIYFLWEQWTLPRLARANSVDILHCPINYGLPIVSPCPTVLTVHDAIGEKYYDSTNSWKETLKPSSLMMNLSNWISRSRSNHVITVSNHAKTDLVNFLKIPEKKISVIYEAADLDFEASSDESKKTEVLAQHGIECPFLFYIGGWEKRKNIDFLIEAFRNSKVANVQLVLAGGSQAEKELLEKKYSDVQGLKLLGWVEDHELPVLYSAARAFIYPSEYEGFGLQLCEAMAVGCPILVSNATSLPEVAGPAGEVFSLENTHELSKMMTNIIENDEYFKTLSEKSFDRSSFFSWQKTARQTFDVYLKLLT